MFIRVADREIDPWALVFFRVLLGAAVLVPTRPHHRSASSPEPGARRLVGARRDRDREHRDPVPSLRVGRDQDRLQPGRDPSGRRPDLHRPHRRRSRARARRGPAAGWVPGRLRRRRAAPRLARRRRDRRGARGRPRRVLLRVRCDVRVEEARRGRSSPDRRGLVRRRNRPHGTCRARRGSRPPCPAGRRPALCWPSAWPAPGSRT